MSGTLLDLLHRQQGQPSFYQKDLRWPLYIRAERAENDCNADSSGDAKLR